MILAVTAEESGLLGSDYFGEKPLVPLKQIVGGVNIDALLPIGRTRDIVVVGYGSSELEDVLRETAAAYDKEIRPDPSPEAGYFYRSDHVSLAKRGVPMLYADPGEDHLEYGVEYGREKSQEYREVAYHKPADEYDPETWDLSGIEESAQIFHEVGAALANSDDWPNWYEGNEFRALRDAQRAGE
jgi:Zn-dependent M28 family amino/carboxypeptidase